MLGTDHLLPLLGKGVASLLLGASAASPLVPPAHHHHTLAPAHRAVQAVQHKARPAPKPKPRPKYQGPWTVYDSASPSGIPRSAAAVAGYNTGPYTWSQSDWNMFPRAVHIRIDIVGGDRFSNVEDVEAHGVPLSAIRGWSEERWRMGYTPIIYGTIGNMHNISARMRGFHHSWYMWEARPNGVPSVVPGSSMTQYEWTDGYDKSITYFSPASMIARR